MFVRNLRQSLLRPVSGVRRFASNAPAAQAAAPRLDLATAQSRVAAWPATRVTTLPNGMRVATETGVGETATVGVWIDTGSRFEDEKSNGVAHFLEHMFFKGTKNRTRVVLEREVENLGGHLNAYTSRENTVFYAKVFKKDVPQAMDILSDILTNSEFSEGAIDSERNVILREMEEVEDQMEEVIFDRLHETAFRGSSLGRTILGPVENIKSITRADIKRYIDTHYTAPRMVVVGAGAVEHGDLVQLSQKLLGKVPATAPNGLQAIRYPARFTGSDIRIRDDHMKVAHIAVGYPTAGWADADNFPLMVIQTMLGSWDRSMAAGTGKFSRSPLVSSIAEGDMAKSITPFNTQYSDTGLFGVYAQCDAVGQYEMIREVMYNITKHAVEVDPGRLEEAKNQLKMNMLAHLDGSTQISEDIGRQILTYGRRMHPLEVLARIDAVDAQAVKNCASRFFWDRDVALAAIGPIHELPDYNFIRRGTYFNTF